MPLSSAGTWILATGLLVGVGLAIALLRMVRDLVRAAAALADSTARIGEQVEALRRAIDGIAASLDRLPVGKAAGVGEGPAPVGGTLTLKIRETIATGLWDEAERLLESLTSESPDHPEAGVLTQLLERGRREAVGDLRARLEASRMANDPDAVLDYLGRLGPLLSDEARRDLDRELVRWLLGILMKRMRTGTVQADVADLATRVADLFPATPEGASLRASLPTLRRSAGLCPRCAKPYAGVENACPECLAAAAAPPGGPTILTIHEDGAGDDEEETALPEDDPFLRDAE